MQESSKCKKIFMQEGCKCSHLGSLCMKYESFPFTEDIFEWNMYCNALSSQVQIVSFPLLISIPTKIEFLNWHKRKWTIQGSPRPSPNSKGPIFDVLLPISNSRNFKRDFLGMTFVSLRTLLHQADEIAKFMHFYNSRFFNYISYFFHSSF